MACPAGTGATARLGARDGGSAPVAAPKAARPLSAGGSAGGPGSFWDSGKRPLLGPARASDQLRVERLSKPLGLGVLSCDGISSGGPSGAPDSHPVEELFSRCYWR